MKLYLVIKYNNFEIQYINDIWYFRNKCMKLDAFLTVKAFGFINFSYGIDALSLTFDQCLFYKLGVWNFAEPCMLMLFTFYSFVSMVKSR